VFEVAQGGGDEAVGGDVVVQAGVNQDVSHGGLLVRQLCGGAHADGEDLGRIVDAGSHLVQELPVLLEDLGHGRLEQLGLGGGEVIVEGPEADIGPFGDLLDAHVGRAPLHDERLSRIEQGPPGASLAPVQPRRDRHLRLVLAARPASWTPGQISFLHPPTDGRCRGGSPGHERRPRVRARPDR
jgi:hypothetical protein